MARLIPQHDRFFKALMVQPGAAAALLRERLPAEIAALLAPEPPERVDGSFIDPDLSTRYTDLLYKARLRGGGEALLYVLIEHKSRPEPRIAWQLLRYMLRIWERCDSERPGRSLPPILPLVVYHGAREWRVPPAFSALLAAPEALRPYLLEFRYTLADLGRIPDAELSALEALRAGFMILKRNVRGGDLRATLQELVQAAQAQGADFLLTVLTYILAEPNQVDETMLAEAVRQALPEQAERIMSIAAERWLEQGKAKGRLEGKAEGRAEGKAEALLRLLGRRFGPLPAAVQARVAGAEPALLDLWLDRLIDAPSLEAVFAPPAAN